MISQAKQSHPVGNAGLLNAKPRLMSKNANRSIFASVLMAHVLFLCIPYLMFIIGARFHKPKMPGPRSISISLIPGDPKLPPGPIAAPKQEPKPEEKPLPPDPEPKPEIKPEPKPEVKPEPKPEIKPEPKVEVKPDIKPEPADKPKIVTDPPKEKKYLRPEDILITKNVVKNPSVKTKTPSTPPRSKVSAASIASAIRNATAVTAPPNSKPGPLGGGGGGGGGGEDSYYAAVSLYLYRLWQEPAKTSLGGAKPVVNVQVSIDDTGRITSWNIVKRSGVPAMDNSVETLFSTVKSLPKPPDGGKTFEISLDTEEE